MTMPNTAASASAEAAANSSIPSVVVVTDSAAPPVPTTTTTTTAAAPESNTPINEKAGTVPLPSGGTSMSMLGLGLGDRMKGYEGAWEMRVPRDQPYLIRVVGLAFSKFTRIFKNKPFDPRFSVAMEAAAGDTLTKFVARTAYTHSDEATFVFAACTPEQSEHPYNGRVGKLCSLLAAYFSVRFNYHVMRLVVQDKRRREMEAAAASVPCAWRRLGSFVRLLWVAMYTIVASLFSAQDHNADANVNEDTENEDAAILARVSACNQCFDARVLVMSPEEIVNHMVWRRRDSERNAISAYARTYLRPKDMHGKHSGQLKDVLRTEYCLDLDADEYAYNKWGVFVKRERYLVPISEQQTWNHNYAAAENHKQKKKNNKQKQVVSGDSGTSVLRTRVITRTFRIQYSKQMVDWLQAKYDDGEDGADQSQSQSQ